jgi:hypothetical protein
MNKLFNYKVASISIISFGIITFIINLNGSIILTIFAALKEMGFRFVFSGFTGRLLQKISDTYKEGARFYFAAGIIPTVIALIFTFILHYFTYTPHPIQTVGVNTVLTFVSGIGTAFLFKRGLFKV